MKWVALLLVVAAAIAAPSLLSDRDHGCEKGFASSPGPLYDEAFPGSATAADAVGSRFDDAARTTSEEAVREDGTRIVVFRGYDAEDRMLGKVEIWQRESGGWYEGQSQVCDRQ